MEDCSKSKTNEVQITQLHEAIGEIKKTNGGVFNRINEVFDSISKLRENNTISSHETIVLTKALKDRIDKVESSHDSILTRLSSLTKSVAIQWFIICSVLGLIFWIAKSNITQKNLQVTATKQIAHQEIIDFIRKYKQFETE